MSESLEYVAELAQRYLSEKPTFVLGSGASIALGLPSMSELGDSLLVGVVPQDKEERVQWAAFGDSFRASGDLEQALNDIHISDSLLSQVVLKTWHLISDRDISAYGRTVASPNFHPLANAFRHFLRVADPRLNVVTTNYDRLAEYAANSAGAQAFVGLTHGWIQQLSANDLAPARRQVNIWKVHGSLDWFEAADRRIVGLPMSRDVLPGMKPVIVTPGITKYRQAPVSYTHVTLPTIYSV